MVFSSVTFIFLFLPIVLLIYFSVRKEFRNAVLLISSIIFYAWGEPLIVLIVLCSLILNYLFGLLINYLQQKDSKLIYHKLTMVFCVLLNIGLLVYYKYTNFLVLNIREIFNSPDIFSNFKYIALPIGISFYTFHELSYVVDIYRKVAKVQKNILNLALYILFFPQLVAGPIIRYHDVCDQLTDRTVDLEGFSYGIRRFLLGLAKKVLIANTMGQVADSIFAIHANNLTAPLAWLGIISYSLQIYFDFSGYSDMAIGIARMFGFKFLENFNYPYISQSITEFWRRWHISLSNWFRDYLYIPLGGNRKGKFKTYRNLIIVFLCTGIWHGASMNFLIWGLYYGVFLILEKTKVIYFGIKFEKTVGRIYTLFVVIIGWVFFRSETLHQSKNYLYSMFGLAKTQSIFTLSYFITPKYIITLIIAIIGCMPIFRNKFLKLENRSIGITQAVVRDIFILAVTVLSILYIANMSYNPFIYFRF